MGKSFTKLKGYLAATWTKLEKNLRTASRRRTWKITETPVSDMKQTAAEGTLVEVYAPDSSLTKSKERDDIDHQKKQEATSDWSSYRALNQTVKRLIPAFYYLLTSHLV